MLIARRKFLTGLGAALAAPAIVRYGNLMPVRSVIWPDEGAWELGRYRRVGKIVFLECAIVWHAPRTAMAVPFVPQLG
jgi:hypothetical protein